MAKTFNLIIIAPDRTIYEGRVSSLVAPAQLGYLGVLANHAPLIASIREGKIVFKEESGRSITLYNQGAGFLEVLKNNVTLLCRNIKNNIK